MASVRPSLTVEQALELYAAGVSAEALMDRWGRLVHTTDAERELYAVKALVLRMALRKLRMEIDAVEPRLLRSRGEHD